MPRPNTNVYRYRADGAVEVLTAKGECFVIDADDVALARRHCWIAHEHGYARAVTRTADGRMRTIYLHRLICKTTQKFPHVDHANGDVADCRRANLRACNRHQNLANAKRRADNTTGFKGVGLHKQTGKFRARVRIAGDQRHLGLFDTAVAAGAAAKAARNALHGEFARHE